MMRAEMGPRVMLAFSRGKDALGAYLALRDSFKEVVPFHLDLVPGLSFVDESIAYYEKAFGRRIIRLPHPSFYRMLNNLTFQPPSQATVIAAAGLPNFDYPDIYAIVRDIERLPDHVMAATGVRAVDSPMRMLAMRTHGPISRGRQQFYPVWDWKKDRLLSEIEKSGIGLPVDYDLFGRTFDGLDLRFLYPLKHKRPEDYRRILEWYPLADVEVWRFERFGHVAA